MQKKCDFPGGHRRVLLELSYRGEDFSGWQSQSHGRGVQDAVEKALAVLCGGPVRIHGAGRTDAGVHALGQCAHFDAPEGSRFAPDEWAWVLNANLPPGVRVLESRAVPGDFHARFDAIGKIYCYRLYPAVVMSPFALGRSWHVAGAFDETLFRDTLRLFVGEHDFRCFCAGLAKRKRSPVRIIHGVNFVREGDFLVSHIHGNGFLFRMVRCMVGIAVRVAKGKMDLGEVAQALHQPRVNFPIFAAPAEGLYLEKVFY